MMEESFASCEDDGCDPSSLRNGMVRTGFLTEIVGTPGGTVQ